MNVNVWKRTLSAGCLLATGLTTVAGPLKRADVASDPAWVAHLDVDALRPTTIGQFIQGEIDKPEAQAKLAALQMVIGIDLRKQLHGCTAYGANSKPEDGVLIVYADFDPDRLVTLAKAANDYQSQTHHAHVIHNWIDEKRKAKLGSPSRTYAAIVGGRILFGQHQASVAAALDVIDGASPTLAESKQFAGFGAAAGFLQAAVRKLDLPESDPNAAMFRLSKLIRLDVAEARQQVKATLTLEANDEETAEHITSIGQGLVALGKLQKEKPEVTKLARAISIKQDGIAITLNLALPTPEVIDLLRADAARRATKTARQDKQ